MPEVRRSNGTDRGFKDKSVAKKFLESTGERTMCRLLEASTDRGPPENLFYPDYYDQRNSLGGKGKFNVGRGLILKLEVRDEVQATWLTELTFHRPRLSKNCSHGAVSEITLENEGIHKNLPVLGQQNFHSGDMITLCSGSGGGFGKE